MKTFCQSSEHVATKSSLLPYEFRGQGLCCVLTAGIYQYRLAERPAINTTSYSIDKEAI